MADQTNESILFEIKINSEQYKAEQKLIRDSLQQLVLDIEKTRAGQKALNKERDAGKLTDTQYSERSVKLREQLKGQLADQRELEKGLAVSQKAYNAAAGSAEQLRAQLFELTTAYYAMSEAERKSAEGQALQKQALAVSDALKSIEGSVGSTGRNVGNYAASFKQGLAPIVAELAKVEAAIKGVDLTSEEGAVLQQKRIGFMTAAQRAAAQAGITDFTEAKATIDQYSQAFTPAVENLVQLQREQQQASQTVGENSEQYQQLGFRVAGAQKALDDVVAAQVAAEKAGQATTTGAVQQAQATTAAAGSLAALRQQLIELLNTRETLDPTTQEAQDLNDKILVLKTRIAEGSGQIDAFGEKIQRNIRKENFDTVTDAVSGLTASLAVANIVFGDNEDAAKAQAKALQLMTIAQSARSIAIGIDSAKDAASIILKKTLSLFLKDEVSLTAAAAVSTEAHAAVAGADAVAIEAQAGAAALNAEGQAASAAATAGSTVATEAQTVATGGATIAQRALNLALRLNPIGLVITLVAALVAGFFAYCNASEQTQQKVRDFTKALLLFTNPLGLAYFGVEKLYQKFASVRAVLDPVIAGFNSVAGAVAKDARALGEWVGLLDTAQQRAAKLAEQQVALAEATVARLDAEAKALELAGVAEEQVRTKQRAGLVERLDRLYDFATKQELLDRKELDRIAKKQRAQEMLSDKEKDFLQKSEERNQKEREAQNALDAFDRESIERKRLAQAAAAADVETNSQRATAFYRRQLEEGIANEKAALQQRVNLLDRRLAAVQLNSAEELNLQRRRLVAQRDLELLNLGPTLAQERALRKQNLGRILADQEESKKLALAQFGLTEQQKQHIEADYRNKAADTRLSFSTTEAQQELKARQDIIKNAAAADLKLTTDHIRQVSIDSLQAEQERNAAALALNAKAQAEQAQQNIAATQQQLAEQYQLQSRAAVLERELAIASLPARTDNTAAELRLRAEANQKLAELDAAQADAARQRRAKELSDEAQHYNLLADGMLAGLTQGEQAQVQATETYKQQRIAATFDEQDARLALVAKGSQEEVNIRQETENKLKQIQRESHQAQLDLLKAQTEKVAAVVTGSLNSLAAVQDADSQAKLARIDAEMNKSTTSAARHDVLEKQKIRVEQQAAEQRRKIARAQAVVQLGAAVMTILAEESILPSPLAEIAKGVEIAAATATAYAQFKAIDSAKFAAGGVLQGRSHAQGGIQLFNRRTGQHMGEAEGDEIILTKGVYRDPALRAIASRLNVLGGGRAFLADSDQRTLSILSRIQAPQYYDQGGVLMGHYLPQALTGGVIQQPIVQAAASPIDYDQLASALAAKLTPAFIAGAQALPAQNLNLTELRDKQQNIEHRESLTNI
jgi:hypothetical protein